MDITLNNDGTVTFEAVLVRETAQAVLLDHDGEPKWFPLSVISDLEEVDAGRKVYEATIPEWLAIQKELV